MSGKRIAVLLSAYNGERYIRKQIESILCQEGIDSLTIIVRNDGSKDGTLGILRQMQSMNSNIEVIDGQNIGLVASFLELLAYAFEGDYDYFSFSDQDDYWMPEKLSIAINAIDGQRDPYMYAACSKIVDDGLVESGEVTQTKIREITFFNSAIQNFCPGHNQVLNRAMAEMVVNKTKYSSAIYSQDLWITNVAAITGKIIFDNTPHTLYRQHANNQLSFGKSKIEWIKDHFKRLQKSEGKKMAVQLKYFTECYEEFLSEEQKAEIDSFFDSQGAFLKRIHYVTHSKMYRQRSYETYMFRIIYLLGGYSI